jgi:RHS repeat-associated protein
MCDRNQQFCGSLWIGSGLLKLFLFLLLAPVSHAAPSPANQETTRQIMLARWFAEPLRLSGQPTDAENRSLLTALSAFAARTNRDDVALLEAFLNASPDSAWAISLRTELGSEYFRTGWHSKAVEAWEQVWRGRTNAGASPAQISVHRAGSHLAGLYARLGRMAELHALLPQLDALAMTGPDAERVRGAKDGLWSMENTPEIAFRCGPLALDRIRSYRNSTNALHPVIWSSKSTTNGMSLTEVAKLSTDLGMNYQLAFRSPGSKFVVPSVVHWKVGHYAGLVRQGSGLYQAQDPTFGDDTWLSFKALDHESSGYFLIPGGALPEGWRPVSEEEGREIFGKGATDRSDPDATSPYDEKANEDDNSCGMATWNAHLLLVSQEIKDTPIGYRPPFGPPVFTTMRYVQRRNERFGYTYRWLHNWQGALWDDALNPYDNILINYEGGWLTFVPDYDDTNLFRCKMRSPGLLTRTSPTNFVWQFPGGAKRIYSTPLTNGGFHFLTGIEDAAGNRISIQVEPIRGRVESVTDPLGQVTRFHYELTDPGEPDPATYIYTTGNWDYSNQVTRIVDPFGRTASIQYAKTLRSVLGFCPGGFCPFFFFDYEPTNIIDVAGLSSQFSYNNNYGSDYISALTTSYGTTRFEWSAPRARNTILGVTHPNGDKERIEYSEDSASKVPFAEVFATVPQNMATWNRYLQSRNTYHWDRKAYAEGFATNDYTKARIYHFAHDFVVNAASGILESIKEPLENRVWFNYPGQALATVPGTSDRPSKIGRVLDDGTTQLQQFEHNSLGNVTRSIDPAGRTRSFIYATNDVDLLEVRQTRAGNNELLVRATYDSRHLPLSIRDAAGQTTYFGYNSRGQILNVTNAKNEVVSFSYDPSGYLLAVDGPLSGAQDRSSFTYDPAGRVRTATDPDGYVLTFDYDSLDRVLKVTFPDGTFQQITYDRLKPGVVRDRLGRETRYTYNSLRQISAIEDPLGRVTRFDWCKCGDTKSLIDPLGRTTTWRHDIQGRVIAKEYADGSKVSFDYERTTSRLRQIRDEQNQLTQFSYHVDDLLKEKRYVNAVIPTPSVLLTYDPDYPRTLSMQDGNGTTTFGYHPVSTLGSGKLASVDGPWANDTITFAHDELGRVVRRAINNATVRRTFDAAGRLNQVTNLLGTFGLTWEAGSARLSAMSYPNGQTAEYAYHPNVRDQLLQRITHRLPSTTILSEFTHMFNAQDQTTNWTQFQGGTLRNWMPAYDSAQRLVAVSIAQSGLPNQTLAYAYDQADNRIIEQENGTTRDFTYNALNQITTISNNPVPATGYRWDAARRLVSLTNGAHQSEFSYDGFGRRTRIVEKQSGVVTSDKRFLWCGSSLCEERDSTGAITLKRFFGRGIRAEAGSDLPAGNYFYTRDHLGSVRELTDGSATVRARYGYSPFGVRERLAGDLNSDFGFTGHYDHPWGGLNLTRYRAYDPRLGRWLSRDPIGESGVGNRYAYVENDPLNKTDVLGLVSAGFSFYNGIGGGISISFDPQTFAVSAGYEIGVGKGVGIDIDPLGMPFRSPESGPAAPRGKWFAEESQATLFGEAEFRAGPIRASAGVQSVESKCDGSFDSPEGQAKICLGPFCIDKDLNITGRLDPTASHLENLGVEKGGGIEAKAGVKVVFPVWEP